MTVDMNNPYAVADHDRVMRKQGFIMGYYGSIRADELVREIKEKLVDYLEQAHGMFITYYVHEASSISMFFNEDKGMIIIEEIEALCNKNADTIFDIKYDNNLPLDVFEYEVLLSGIKRL
jgi:hypothetical protein